MTVVDASIWVSSLVNTDVHHEASTAWLGASLQAGDSLTIPTLALAEVAGAVSRRGGGIELGERAAIYLARIPGLRMVPLGRDLAEEAARLAAAFRVRGADAVYVAVARVLNLPLVTLDRELERRAGSVVRINLL